MERLYLLITESSCFELSGDEKYGLFLSQEVDGKMIFTWSFRVFHDIPGLVTYVFWSSVFPELGSYICYYLYYIKISLVCVYVQCHSN